MEKDSRIRLIEAATPLFAQKGFAGVSIRELAEAAGVNSALISYHFGGKEGLYEAVLEGQFAPVANAINAAGSFELSPSERIAYYAKAVNAAHKQSPYLIRFMHGEMINPTICFETVVKKYIGKIFGLLTTAFVDGVAAGQFNPDFNPAQAAISLAGIMNFYFLAKPVFQSFLPLNYECNNDEKYLTQALNIYLNGVRRINYE